LDVRVRLDATSEVLRRADSTTQNPQG